jgi:hypothetical protein
VRKSSISFASRQARTKSASSSRRRALSASSTNRERSLDGTRLTKSWASSSETLKVIFLATILEYYHTGETAWCPEQRDEIHPPQQLGDAMRAFLEMPINEALASSNRFL